MNELAQQIRDALQTLNLDVKAAALDRAAVVAAVEIGIAAKLPRLVRVTGAEWVTLKALPDADAVTVGSLALGTEVQAGAVECDGSGSAEPSPGLWRPIYGVPIGYAKANLLTEV